MAARIAGITLPQNKPIHIGLCAVYGIGRKRAQKILAEARVDGGIRVKDLSDEQVKSIREIVEKAYRVEGDLKREVLGNIKRMKEIGAYRGSRHAKRLPARGQRTKTNSRTVRGNKRQTMGSGRRVLTKT
ncbi:MAG: 30S ribosomal protein S13 [Parcubacteria group bacterium GW2011_GWA2_56_7]|nr:MAG: 30S ribosomal protein S13 [Parcubacteria group bacterium GW2011_GWA2_56_7]